MIKPEIERGGEAYYSARQARALLAQHKADPDLPPSWVGQTCLHACEAQLIDMLNKGYEPHLIGRAYIAPMPMADGSGRERLTTADEKEKLEWASDVLKHLERASGTIDLTAAVAARSEDWRSVNGAEKKWLFHIAPTIIVWQDAIEKPTPMILDTTLCGDEPLGPLGFKKMVGSTSGDSYLFHGMVSQAPQLLHPALQGGDIFLSPSVALNFQNMMAQKPDLNQIEPLELGILESQYRDMLRQHRDEARAYETTLHPQTKEFIEALNTAARGRVKDS